MKTLLPAIFICVACIGCSKHSGAPVTWHGVTLDSGCLADAIQCYNEVGEGTGRNILLIRYVNSGVTYGHAMCVYCWPKEGEPGQVWYAFDQNHASFPLPASVDHSKPVEVAKYLFPSEVSAWYASPDTTPTL